MAKISFNIYCLICEEPFRVSPSASDISDIEFLCQQGLYIQQHNTCVKLEDKWAKAEKKKSEECKDADKPAQP